MLFVFWLLFPNLCVFILLNISVIELACGEYGDDKIDTLVAATQNGRLVQWCDNFEQITTYPPTGMFFLLKNL